MRVFVYWNSREGMFSVASRDRFVPGRVFLHADRIVVSDARFVVSSAGRRRVLDTGQKCVHAGVLGDVVEASGTVLVDPAEVPFAVPRHPHGSWDDAMLGRTRRVIYNPRTVETFVVFDDAFSPPRPIHRADVVYMDRVHGVRVP